MREFAPYYDPANSRFLSQDTYRGENTDPNSLHLYSYCSNDPINFIDPSGHKKYSSKKKYVYKWYGIKAATASMKISWYVRYKYIIYSVKPKINIKVHNKALFKLARKPSNSSIVYKQYTPQRARPFWSFDIANRIIDVAVFPEFTKYFHKTFSPMVWIYGDGGRDWQK